MERAQKVLLQGLLGSDVFLEALAAAVKPEIDELTKKMRSAVRGGDMTLAADFGGQLTGLERIVPLLQRMSKTSD